MQVNVLVVDDIFTNQFLLISTLETLGYQVKAVNDGKKAIAELQNSKYDIVLMDIEMPVMNGIDATRYIRKNLPEPLCTTPVIALTAHNPYDYEDYIQDSGFNEMITKPYSIEKISDLIQKYVIDKK